MKHKRLHPDSDTHALIFDAGDEVMSGLAGFARAERIHAGHFTAIGAFSSATIAYFDWEKKDYIKIPVDEQVEVLVLAGDVAWHDGEPSVHAHVVLGRRDGSTRGGHLIEARVRPTLEVMFHTGGALEKHHDPASGLTLVSAR